MMRIQTVVVVAIVLVVIMLLPNGLIGALVGTVTAPSDPGDCWELATGTTAPIGAHVTASSSDGSGVLEFPAHGGGTCVVKVPPSGLDTFHRSDVTWRP